MDAKNHSQDRRESPAKAVQLDPAASAALAEAIKSAKESVKPSASSSQAGMDEAPRRWTFPTKPAAQAAFALLLVGAGWSASYMGTLANRDAIRKLEVETARSQEILARLGTDLDALKSAVAAAKDVEHTASTASVSGQAKLADKVERLAVALQEPGKKITSLEGRLDRMESQIMTTLAGLTTKPASAAAPAAPPVADAAAREEAPAPKPAKIEPPAKTEPPAKAEPVDGWVLREVYNGAALVESRNRRLYEVMPGGILPGVGRVEAIERRGTRWVVLTNKGFIGTYR
jgi:cytoskeletal protein RodZ